MKKLLLAFVLLPSLALAQEQPTPVPFTKEEMASALRMCGLARWAARVDFEGVCENLQKKFADAEKAAIKPVEKKK